MFKYYVHSRALGNVHFNLIQHSRPERIPTLLRLQTKSVVDMPPYGPAIRLCAFPSVDVFGI